MMPRAMSTSGMVQTLRGSRPAAYDPRTAYCSTRECYNPVKITSRMLCDACYARYKRAKKRKEKEKSDQT